MKQEEKDYIIEKSKRIAGISTWHLNYTFHDYWERFCKRLELRSAQRHLRTRCNQLEKEGVLRSEWGGTGQNGYAEFGVIKYKSWHFKD